MRSDAPVQRSALPVHLKCASGFAAFANWSRTCALGISFLSCSSLSSCPWKPSAGSEKKNSMAFDVRFQNMVKPSRPVLQTRNQRTSMAMSCNLHFLTG
ncbi:Lactoylglutathione lyase / glyoxalase I family protein [Zea mays]|uniref:Lactoylglutathione lyase / glyoxalase I family protein n=1 Tax=Zea mays TaxID=4577 RepID=A0A1D6NVE1_MAIZE|nr:Lactoylglutathione lyase / glyoxalase I family protein [Zea mays]AQL02095.1 Lactoylglutathione lyase / glyoxalase I family protein [Zea mays]